MPKKMKCVTCGAIMAFDYNIMGDHASKPHSKWAGFVSADD